MYRAAVIICGVLSLSSVSCAFLEHRDLILNTLRTRQTTANACTSLCQPFQNSLTCSGAHCFCTTAVETSLQDCVNCAVAASSTPDIITSSQNLTHLFEQACEGVDLPTPTIPSLLPANPSATGPATAGPPSSSVSGAPTKATTSTDLLPFATDTVLPTTFPPPPSTGSATATGAGSTPTGAKGSAYRAEAGAAKVLLTSLSVGVGVIAFVL